MIFYMPKHLKPNPSVERAKHAPKWIWGECVFYICWYKDRIIDFHNLLIKFGQLIIANGIKLIDKFDLCYETHFPIWKSKIKNIFENIKNICYNIYRKLRKKTFWQQKALFEKFKKF